jgi:hypothetical protein
VAAQGQSRGRRAKECDDGAVLRDHGIDKAQLARNRPQTVENSPCDDDDDDIGGTGLLDRRARVRIEDAIVSDGAVVVEGQHADFQRAPSPFARADASRNGFAPSNHVPIDERVERERQAAQQELSTPSEAGGVQQRQYVMFDEVACITRNAAALA